MRLGRIIGICGWIVCFWFVSICGAEIYRYVDAMGTIRFTDNLQDVPEAQRPQIQRIPDQSIDNTMGAASGPQSPSPSRNPLERVPSQPVDPQEVRPTPAISSSSDAPDIVEEGRKLNAERNRLDQEYLELIHQQAALSEQRPHVRDHEAMTCYNEEVNRLNARTDAYEAHRKAFEQKVEAFNQSLRQYLDRPIEPSQPSEGGGS